MRNEYWGALLAKRNLGIAAAEVTISCTLHDKADVPPEFMLLQVRY